MKDLPKDCSEYITNELGRDLEEVAHHRLVRGENELYYAVLMGKPSYFFTVIFVGKYSVRRPLGDYEEAYEGNARLDGWECLSDGDPWEHSVGKFKNAAASFILSGGEE